jgi:chromosome segregation ATPase
VDIDALKAAAAELAALKAEAAEAKKLDREARKRAQEDAEKAGELAKALEQAKSRLAELEASEPLAAKWRSYEAEEAKRLDGEAAALPEAVRDLYASAVDIEAKRKVLAAFRATSSTTTPIKGQPPSMGAPSPVSALDIETALADKSGAKLAEIKKRDPGAVAAFFNRVLAARGGSQSLGVGRFASSSTKAPNA